MRFSLLATIFAAGSALAAPLTARIDSTAATTLVQALNQQLEGSTQNIALAVQNTDKTQASQGVSSELQSMTSKINNVVEQLGGTTTNARRAENESLAQATKTTVDTVQQAADSVNTKLAAGALKSDMIPLFGAAANLAHTAAKI